MFLVKELNVKIWHAYKEYSVDKIKVELNSVNSNKKKINMLNFGWKLFPVERRMLTNKDEVDPLMAMVICT